MATTRSVVSLIALAGRATAGDARGRRLLTLACAAAFTASTSWADASSRKFRTPIFGLATMATAPAASACMVAPAPLTVSDEQITTGVGRSDMTFFRNVMPSMRGISTSSTITSGQSRCMR